MKVGQVVAVSKLVALPWATNGRNGVAFRAEEIKAAGGLFVGQDRLTGPLNGCHLECSFTSDA